LQAVFFVENLTLWGKANLFATFSRRVKIKTLKKEGAESPDWVPPRKSF
jgi:hypothetical protein